jgi:hypothetical protein
MNIVSMRVVRPLILGCALAASLASIGPGDDPIPEPDSCDDPTTEGVATIDFLRAAGTEQVADMETHELIYGPQGGSMLPLRFGLEGAAVPACAGFDLRVERCLDGTCTQIDDSETFPLTPSLTTYESAGGRATKEYLLILPFGFQDGALVRVTAAVGGVENSLLVWIEQEGDFVDAGPADAGLPDANFADAQPDATP